MRATNFLPKLLAAVPKSPPNARHNNHDAIEPINGWMFPRNTAGHHKQTRSTCAKPMIRTRYTQLLWKRSKFPT
jgi:hypothetical protein